MKKLYLSIITCLLVTGSLNLVSAASPKKANDACQLITSNEAINRAKKQSGGGKVVSVKLKRNGKHSVYRVRVLVAEKRIKNLSIKACR
ncbi:PepSY domain-containing protein [Aliikangiella sp. IMCC44359]|uniref:PepSY domain-containing protein n=1 Tax=Aliikangiella sp. IMCC44359 TaxID=3459125 RepID=UPI00403AE3B1